MSEYSLSTPVTQIPGIAKQRASGLAKLGIFTLRDALNHYPHRYEDRTKFVDVFDAEDGDSVCLTGIVLENPRYSFVRKGMDLVKFNVADDTGKFTVTYFNQEYMRNKFAIGQECAFYGKVKRENGFVSLANPEYERVGAIIPVYRATSAVSQKILLGLVEKALDCVKRGELTDHLPLEILEKYDLLPLDLAIKNIHFPENNELLQKARRRLVFDEFFFILLALSVLRSRNDSSSAFRLPGEADYGEFYRLLPFTPTSAQIRAVADADADITSGKKMNRLVQGDVGSGKTMVAAALIWRVCLAGYQAAYMAPTEILAEQHYATLSKWLSPFGIRTVLLRGGMNAKEKADAKRLLRSGEARLAVGTHALISKGTEFFKLALTVTDEQHRFGVAQRGALNAKGAERPHTLVMSATPIPRTLAVVIYGDLDVSIIDELPPGRQEIITSLTNENYRGKVNKNIEKLVGVGRQVYVICPAIEDSSTMEMKSVLNYADKLQGLLKGKCKVSPLHGRMKSAEKERIMADFASGEIDVLVSTTVVEVGMDVPNAALIVIENAERFGLSQLHQLRGRVGRGAHQSYCVMFCGGGNEETIKRLKAFCATTDGFKIAEADLRFRGPGEFFGNRQHGLPELKIADLRGDEETLREAQAAAGSVTPQTLERYPRLAERVQALLDKIED